MRSVIFPVVVGQVLSTLFLLSQLNILKEVEVPIRIVVGKVFGVVVVTGNAIVVSILVVVMGVVVATQLTKNLLDLFIPAVFCPGDLISVQHPNLIDTTGIESSSGHCIDKRLCGVLESLLAIGGGGGGLLEFLGDA